jgi:aflatoxin B1 aldehyde reductase
MASHEPKIIFGGGAFYQRAALNPTETVSKFLNDIEELKIGNIDTAAFYGDSEELLGLTNATTRFIIDTKFPAGLTPTTSTKEGIVKSAAESLRRLNTKTVSTL